MNKLSVGLILTMFLMVFPVFSQSSAIELIEEGIKMHDQGAYEKAVTLYKQALDAEPNSSLAHYEIAMTYFAMKEYKLSEKHSRRVLENNDQTALPAYITLGNSLDLQGKTEKAIAVYEEGIEKYDHYLLHYNHAMTCYNNGILDKAYESAVNAINNNSAHSSSHLILSKIMAEKNSRVKAMLPLYFFLMTEPHTERAKIEYATLKEYMAQGVSKGSETQINISLPMSSDSDFGAAEMMISMSRATETLEENKGKSELELFAMSNENLFAILGELRKDQTGIWWDLYVDFFAGIQAEGLVDPFSYYISLSQGEAVTEWLQQHEEDFQQLASWLSAGGRKESK